RTEIENEIEAFSVKTTSYLNAYKAGIFTGEDKANFQKLLNARAHYLEVRKNVISLIDNRQKQEALVLFRNRLLPAYNAYKGAGEILFEYNMKEGRSRGETIMTVCTITQFVVAAVGILVFVIGFLVGLLR